MLCAGAGARKSESNAEPEQSAGKSGQSVAATGQRCAEGKYHTTANPLRETTNRNLQSRHGAGIKSAHEGEHPVAQRELGLPNRKQYIDQVRVAVVQRMREARDYKGAPRRRMTRRRARDRCDTRQTGQCQNPGCCMWMQYRMSTRYGKTENLESCLDV